MSPRTKTALQRRYNFGLRIFDLFSNGPSTRFSVQSRDKYTLYLLSCCCFHSRSFSVTYDADFLIPVLYTVCSRCKGDLYIVSHSLRTGDAIMEETNYPARACAKRGPLQIVWDRFWEVSDSYMSTLESCFLRSIPPIF